MRNIGILMAGAALGAAAPAAAQDRAGEAPASDDIIVTGEKTSRTLQETVTSVAVTTPARIRQEAIVTIQDVYNRTANISETYGAAGFTIRGITNVGVGSGGNADTASVYVDGAPIPSEALYGGPTDLWDVEQVEILRGPQSTIQGLNALAGAIVIRTRDASTTSYSADARLLWTEYADRTFSVAAGGPIVADQLGFRFSAERRADRGIIRAATRGGYADSLRSLNLRGKLRWTPTALPGLDVQASYNRVRRDGGYLYEYARSDVPDLYRDRRNLSDGENSGHVRSDIAVLNVGYEIAPALRLSSVTSFNRVATRAISDGDGTPANLEVIDNDQRFRTWTQELRLNYEGERLSGVVGAWAYRRSGGLRANNVLRVPTPTDTIVSLLQASGFPAAVASQVAALYTAQLPVIPVLYAGAQDELVRTAALFADGKWRVTDRLSLIAGFRIDHEANRYGTVSTATFTGTLPDPAAVGAPGTPLYLAYAGINQGVLALVAAAASPPGRDPRSFDAFLPKAGVTMEWTRDLATSLTVQRAYRSGGSSQNPARALLVPYDPEHSWNVEGALRSRWLDGRLTLNANVFYVDWKDQQTNVFLGTSPYDYNTVNAGKSHLYGFEVEAQARLARGWDGYASVGHVRTKFDEFNLPEGTTSNVELAGSEFPYAAHWTLAAGVNAQLGRVIGNLNANYRGPVFTNVGTTQGQLARLPGRTVVNGRLGYALGGVTLFGFVRNLLDERYKQYDFEQSGQAILGDPQTFGGGVEVHW